MSAIGKPLTVSISDAFGAIQRVGLLGEFDSGTWLRHLLGIYGPSVIERPLFHGEIVEAVFRARRASPDLEHTHGHSARIEGLFLPRHLNDDDEEVIAANLRALAAHFGVDGLELRAEEAYDIEQVFYALGRAFTRAGVPQRVFLVGTSEPMILIREALAPVGPFSPVQAYDPSVDRGPRAW